MGEDILDMEPKAPKTACDLDSGQSDPSEGAQPMIVNVAFPFTLATPPFGPSRPYVADHAAKIAYVKAVEAELASLDDELRARPVAAVRLSGGASIMNADSMCHLVRSIRKTLALDPHAEISIDVEPITVCTPSLTDWTSCGINRVNLAAVSVHDDELQAMGAAHTRDQLQNALLFLGKFHMSRVSVELMYGLPRQTRASWEHTLLTVADLGIRTFALRRSSIGTRAWPPIPTLQASKTKRRASRPPRSGARGTGSPAQPSPHMATSSTRSTRS